MTEKEVLKPVQVSPAIHERLTLLKVEWKKKRLEEVIFDLLGMEQRLKEAKEKIRKIREKYGR